jgi:hypothetical protein
VTCVCKSFMYNTVCLRILYVIYNTPANPNTCAVNDALFVLYLQLLSNDGSSCMSLTKCDMLAICYR